MKTSKFYIKCAYLHCTFCIFFTLNITAQNTTFYGMTPSAGENNEGTIFSYTPDTYEKNCAYSFKVGSDVSSPRTSLVYDPVNDLFYGMSSAGGEYGIGAIFTFNPNTGRDSVLWSFKGGLDGAGPEGSLLYDSCNGMFYGMTTDGGSDTLGTIISFNPWTGRDSVLWSFKFGADGVYPEGGFVYDPDNGLLYGMTTYGGNNGWGTILSFDPNTGRDSILWSLGARLGDTGVTIDGADPFNGSTPVYDPDNKLLYAITAGGGIYYGGALISFNPVTGRDSLLWSFGNGYDGWYPLGSLIYNRSNRLFYGMTCYGGDSGYGTIFSFDPSTNSESVVWSFQGSSDGANPGGGSFVCDPQSGLLYGMTLNGGLDSMGTIISFDPSTNTENVAWYFVGSIDGDFPTGSLVVYPPSYTAIKALANNPAINIYPSPSSGLVNLSGLDSGQIIEIYDYLGQKVNWIRANNVDEHIDVSARENGIYFIEVINNDGSVLANKKVVKMN